MGLFSGIGKAISGVVKGVSGAVSKVASVASPFLSAVSPYAPLISAGLGYLGQSSANKANQDIANRQMQFQADMSGTAYQRAVKDMEAAGLNPMLAYSQGGASTPQGASIPVQNEFSSAQQAQLISAQMDNIRADTDQKSAQTGLIQAQSLVQGAQAISAQSAAQTSVLDLKVRQALADMGSDVSLATAKNETEFQSAVRDNALARSSRDTVNTLNSFAVSNGFKTFDEMVSRSDWRQIQQFLRLQAAQIPSSEAIASWAKAHPDLAGWLAPISSSASSLKDLSHVIRR